MLNVSMFRSSLVELDDLRIDGPYLPDELALDHLDADCPILLYDFDSFELQVLD